jgi:hypothetical protein
MERVLVCNATHEEGRKRGVRIEFPERDEPVEKGGSNTTKVKTGTHLMLRQWGFVCEIANLVAACVANTDAG